MSSRYDVAIEKQFEALRASLRQVQQPELRIGAASGEFVNIQDDIQILQVARPMFWSTRCVEAVVATMDAFDLSQISVVRELVPFDFGWMWFEKAPFQIGTRDSPTATSFADAVPCVALSWAWCKSKDGVEMLAGTCWCIAPPQHFVPTATIWFATEKDRPFIECPGITTGPDEEQTYEEILRAKRFFICACTFLRQELFHAEETRIERHARKRLKKDIAAAPDTVQVVYMRKVVTTSVSQDTSIEGGEARSVNWQWQWLVRPHTRQQWYPTLQKHLPILIMPYWKGPEGKPVKPRTTPIIAVTR